MVGSPEHANGPTVVRSDGLSYCFSKGLSALQERLRPRELFLPARASSASGELSKLYCKAIASASCETPEVREHTGPLYSRAGEVADLRWVGLGFCFKSLNSQLQSRF